MSRTAPIRMILVLTLVIGVCGWLIARSLSATTPAPIRVGILHSLTGTMAFSERPVVDAALMAIEEINRAGGLLGRTLVPVIADGHSDEQVFRQQAEHLIREEHVSVIFGCWTSASRKTVKTVVEQYDHLLFYPVQYEGLEESSNIIYTGAAPNQQIIPAINWVLQNLGTRIFLVGSDYVFPRTANLIIQHQISALHGTILGERYIPLGSEDTGEMVAAIRQAQPDVILNTINGHSNEAFFRELRRQGITPDRIPTLSFSIGEHELQDMGPHLTAGDYAAWSYFQGVETPANRKFVQSFRNRYGRDRVVDDPMEAEYFSVKLWAQAVRNTGSFDPTELRRAVGGLSYMAPEGYVYLDPDNFHTWRKIRIGQMRDHGQFKILWSSEEPVRPVPFPIYRSRERWIQFLVKLNEEWEGHWARPVLRKGEKENSL